jgi:hypothetical protein
MVLLEVLIATAICVAGIVSALHVVGQAMTSTRVSRDRTISTQLAAQKLAELTAVPLEVLVDTTADAWLRSVAGAYEYLDRAGEVLSVDVMPPSAHYVRRWAVTSGMVGGTDWRAIDVSVSRAHRQAVGDAGLADMVRLTTLRTRWQ